MEVPSSKPPKPPVVAPKPGVVHVFRAMYDYTAQQEDELSFTEGDILYVTEDTTSKDWIKARCGAKQGLIPANYVELKLDSIENPIHDATRRGNLTNLSELLQHGVSPGSLDLAGNTGLHWAARGGHIECCQALLNHVKSKGQNLLDFLDVQNKLGETALHLAAYKGHLPIVKLFLESGSDPSIRNLNGERPIDIATEADVRWALEQLSMNEAAGVDEEYLYEDDDDDVHDEVE